MPDLLEQSAAWLDGQRHQHLSRPVIYRRGNQEVELQATVGQTVFRLNDQYGATIRHVSRDYLIRATDLVFDSTTVRPERGDLIVEGERIYEVMSPSANEPEWRWSGGFGKTLRIHTQETHP